MTKDEAWVKFACAAINPGADPFYEPDIAENAVKIADEMLKQFEKRFTNVEPHKEQSLPWTCLHCTEKMGYYVTHPMDVTCPNSGRQFGD